MKLYLVFLFCALASGEPDPWDEKHLLYKPALKGLFATLPTIRQALSLSDNEDIKLTYVYQDWMDLPVSYRVHFIVIDRDTGQVSKENCRSIIDTKMDSNGKVVYHLDQDGDSDTVYCGWRKQHLMEPFFRCNIIYRMPLHNLFICNHSF